MNIQTRITLLLIITTSLFFTGLLFMKKYENRREELLIKNNIFEKNTLFDKVLRLEGASLEIFAYDFSNRDEMVRLTKQPVLPRKGVFIEGVLPSFNVNTVWIFDADYDLIYSNASADIADYQKPHADRATFFTTLFSRSYFCRFFMYTPTGLMEVRSAPIQPADDPERKTPPAGYLFAGRLWSPGYLQQLSQSAESTIQIFPIKGELGKAFESTYDQENGLISFSRVKNGWDDTPIIRITVESRTPLTKELHRSSKNQLILVIVFVSTIIFLLSALLIIWVNIPLKRISASLHAEDPSLIEGFQTKHTEFGNLAVLILRFFRQKTELTREIAERQRAEEALRTALQESQRSEAETAALLQASRAVLEYHEFREASREIITAFTTLSGAAEGYVGEIITDAETYILRTDNGLKISLQGIYNEAYSKNIPCFYNDCDQPSGKMLLPDGHENVENILCAPLVIKGFTVALLTLINKPGGFSDNDIRMASAFSELSSVALLNSRTLESLENSEERFRSVVQTAGDGIISVKSDGNIAFWNRGAEKIFGYTAEEAAGMDAAMVLPERFRPMYKKGVAQISDRTMETVDTKPIELVGMRKDGSELPIELSQAIWRTKEGIFFTAIVRDITERKMAEENLRKSEKRFRDIVEHSLTGRFIVQEGHIVYKNEEQARLFGDMPEDFNILKCTYVHPEDLEKTKTFYQDILSRKTVARDVNYRFYPLGQMNNPSAMRWVTCRGTMIEYEGREALFVNMMDITRFMELEELVRIDDKMASLGRVAAGIAHEIRNPLTGINSYLYSLNNMLSSGTDDIGKSQEIINQIQSASNKIEGVIRRVMDFSKPSRPKLAPININEPIEEALHLSAVTLRKSGISVEKSLAADLPPCYADFHMMEQVMLNLTTNAIHALSSAYLTQKRLAIHSLTEGEEIIITVSDSGPGIPEENSTKVFDPFYTTKSDGSGIGLSLCQRIVADHGGSIKIARSCWGGAEFRIALPIKARAVSSDKSINSIQTS